MESLLKSDILDSENMEKVVGGYKLSHWVNKEELLPPLKAI